MNFDLPTFSPRLRIIALMTATSIASMAGFGAYLGLRLSDNVHVIESGLAYRSGQLWPSELEAVIEESGIRSIVSLVPAAPDEYWYRAELAVSSARGIVRYEMPLSAQTELSSDQLWELLSLLQKAPKPVLIHSKNGADRSGLAAAIFQYAIALRPVEEARKQLSIRYGHFPYLWSGTEAMDASFRRFLAEQHASAPSPEIALQIPPAFR
jgi:protein tyrosine/serine phosphatase